jgi:hypothetical protein
VLISSRFLESSIEISKGLIQHLPMARMQIEL